MSNIINSNNTKDIKIEKYQFNKLNIDDDNKQNFDSQLFSHTQANGINTDDENENKSEDNLELLEKIDTLTSEIVTLQMELDTQKSNFEQELDQKSKLEFDNGKKEGIQETIKTLQDDHDELKNQLIKSITSLDQLHNTFKNKLDVIEEELIESSIFIAKKVIKNELDHQSEKIAISIASTLIDSIKETTKITIKVNKNDFSSLSEHFNQDSINIIADDAISPGGIIIFSNDANIDATITTRLNQALELIGKE